MYTHSLSPLYCRTPCLYLSLFIELYNHVAFVSQVMRPVLAYINPLR
jgi:hypothetical protein